MKRDVAFSARSTRPTRIVRGIVRRARARRRKTCIKSLCLYREMPSNCLPSNLSSAFKLLPLKRAWTLQYIPSFEDDPKNRFMDEIAFTDTPVSPRKRTRTDPPQDGDRSQSREGAKGREKKEVQVTVKGILFFAVGVSVPEHHMPSPRPPPLVPQPGQVPAL